MADTINFVRERRRLLTKTQQKDYFFFKIAVGSCGVVVGIFLIVIATQFFFNYQLNQLNQRRKSLENTVVSQDSTERSYLILTNKLKVLSQLLAARSNKQAAINFFTNLFGSEVLIKELDYKADSDLISFGLEAESVFVLERVLAQLSSEEVTQQFDQVATSELRRANTGIYNVTVTVTLADKPAATTRTQASPQPNTGSSN